MLLLMIGALGATALVISYLITTATVSTVIRFTRRNQYRAMKGNK